MKKNIINKTLDEIELYLNSLIGNIQHGGENKNATSVYFYIVELLVESTMIKIVENENGLTITHNSNKILKDSENTNFNTKITNNKVVITNFNDFKDFRTYMCLNKHRFPKLTSFEYIGQNGFTFVDCPKN